MSIKDFNKQTVTNATFDAATRPVAPIITGYTISGSDDTALDPAGGQTILVNGSGFRPGATITLNNQNVSVVSFISVDQLSFTSPALSAGTYNLFVVNTDNGAGILTPGLIYSTFPTWTTTSGSQGSYYETTSINNSFVATSDTAISSYTLDSGTLPPGSSLASNGVLTGTAPAASGSTTYTFTLKATDSELQDSTRSFSLTINTDVVSWSSPSDGSSYSLIGNQAMANVTLSATSAAGSSVSYSANALPTGVTLSSGTISGTPTVAETVSTLLTATAATTNRTATRTISWTVSLGDAFWKNVSLLLSGSTPTTTFINDASLNNNQLTIAGDTKPNKFTPYSPGYYSWYIPINIGAIASVPVAAANLGAGDFTIEMWINTEGITYTSTLINAWSLGGSSSYEFYISGSRVAFFDGTNIIQSATGVLTIGAWYHVAAVRSGSTLTLYSNGVSVASGTCGYTMTPAGTAVYIGGTDSSQAFGGYISNVRIVKGTAVYTSAFTPPTAPLTAITNTILLTAQSPMMIDNSVTVATVSLATDGAKTTAVHPFPALTTVPYNTLYSTQFDGTGDYITVPNNSGLYFTDAGDNTFECWINIPNFSTNKCICYNRYGGTGWSLLSQITTGNLFFVIYEPTVRNITSSVAPTPGAWNHIALVRSGSTVTLYLNGVSVGTVSNTSGVNETTQPIYIGSQTSGGNPLTGWISNVRFVKGTAVYTTNFTPPTSPLTAIANTSLLTCQDATLKDNSTNNLVITSVGGAKPIAASPFAMTTSSTTVTSLGSAYFDGTGDYLQSPPAAQTAANWAFTGDFTIECWVYPTNQTYAEIASSWVFGNASASGWIASINYVTGKTRLTYGVGATNTNVDSTSTGVITNAWNHIAFTRTGTTLTFWINGINSGTATVSGTLNTTTNPLSIGAGYGSGQAAANLLTGYIQDLRIIKGTALYTSNFLPPQTPLTPVANTQLLTLQYNGGANNNGFVDQSSFNNVVTRTGNVTQGTFSPYSQNGWSNYFDGSSYLAYNWSTGVISTNLTVEGWIYQTTTGTNLRVMSYAIDILVNAGKLYWYTLGSTDAVITPNTWIHFAWTLLNGVRTLYINGVSVPLTGTNDGTFTLNGSSVYIGQYTSGTGYGWKGYISNIRVTKAIVYTANFTPPTAPLTAIPNTYMLACQSNRFVDNAPTNYTVTPSGTPSVQAYSPFGGITSVPTSYSTKFDGTSGSYFTFTGKSSLALGSGDFTIESWVYRNTTTGAGGSADAWYTGTRSPSGGGGLGIKITNGGQLAWNNNSSYGVGTIAIPAFTWAHIAVTRESGTLKWYINGVLDYSISMPNNYSNPTAAIGITDDPYYSTLTISNFRLVTGLAVYTGNFTVPAGILTATQSAGTNIAAITTQTALLTCQNSTLVDNSSTPATVTQYGTAQRQITFNPFGITSTTLTPYTPSVNSGSMYFDGTGDYLTIPYSPNYSPPSSTTAWTIEFWFYCTSSVTGNQGLFRTGTAGIVAIAIVVGSGSLYIDMSSNGSTWAWSSGAKAMTLNQWNHFALVRNGSTTTAYLNGVSYYSAASTTLYSSPASLYLGYDGANAPYYLNGYLADVRVVNGTALYTANFYPSSAPATPTQTIGTTTYSSSLLLNGTSGGIIDYHSTNDLETVGNTQLGSEDPYGGRYYSNYFDGTGDYLSLANNAAFDFGSGDLTIECWFMLTADSVANPVGNKVATLFTTLPASGTFTNDWTLGIGGDASITGTNIGFNARQSGTNQAVTYTSTITKGVWHHIAATKTGNTVSLYYDGARVAQDTNFTNNVNSNGTGLKIGAGNYGTYLQPFAGYISNLRLVKGSVLYTGTTYTPSTTPLTAVANTSLLTCQSNSFKDNSTNNFTITKNGDTKVKSMNPFQQNTGKSLYFDGNDSLLARSNPTLPLTGDFTVECWIYMTALNTNNMIIGGDNGANSDYLNITSTSINMAINGGLVYPSWSYTFTTGQWYYITITRTGTSMNAYINGVAQTAQTYAQQFIQTNVNLYIGRYGYATNPWYFTGYIKDLRITRGAARYTTTFTPPTIPLQNK